MGQGPAFAPIEARAAARHGGAKLLAEMLPVPKTAAELTALPDDRYLAAMARQIFRTGFSWKVIEAKWPGFEEAFEGFDPGRLVMLPDDGIDALLKDTRIVRNGPKIRSTLANARYVWDISKAHGGFGRYVADWPGEDIVGLWTTLKKGGDRLGGNTGPLTLRIVGKDTFVLSNDVVKALVGAGIVDKAPSGKKALAQVQDAFNAWQAETGRPLCQLSRILAMSVD